MPESQYPQAFCYVNLVKSPTRLPEDPILHRPWRVARPIFDISKIKHSHRFKHDNTGAEKAAVLGD